MTILRLHPETFPEGLKTQQSPSVRTSLDLWDPNPVILQTQD